MDKRFQWTSFYMELASALLKYKNNRSELIGILKTIFSDAEMNFPFKEKGKEVYEDICPFTVFGSFNKGITNANRIALLEQFAKQFSIKAAVPTEFDGIPVVMNLSAWFFAYKENRGEHDIDNLWELLEKAIAYSDEASADNKNAFITAYDTVSKQKMIKWNITMGLYWVRPYTFINLDSTNRAFITDVDNMPHYFTTIFSDINKGIPDGTSYLFMCEQAKNALKQKEYEYHSFPELSYCAWKNNQETPDEPATNRVDSNVKEIDYWIYSPGDNACMWDEFYNLGIMGIGWDDVTDLKEFTSKEEIKDYMKKVYDPSYSYKNNAHCLWQFANEIKIGDVIFVKKGMHKIIGKGVVTSEYIYDSARETYKHIRKVEWTNKGEWEHPGQAVMKTLTCISPYPDYVQRLLSLFAEDILEETSEQIEIKYPPYTKDDFLNKVYMDEDTYNTLTELLEAKYNVILQGAPGVGKTFAAKRLAYSIMGQKDTSRVAMVQFHQSYSYEDFIQGYRPSKDGFELVNGAFYKFCKEAEEDNERPYFFIIDEINRGNLSKILGELMMLIEKDKRGEKIKLLYSNEWFTVPQNVRIIGMMNTADRSLALMDYALRRRFAFFDFAPAFSSEGFKNYLSEKDSPKLEKLIAAVESLNSTISTDESLGDGFRIGHSYFCTDDEITDEWLKSVVEYEVIPLIKEYWFDEPTKVRDWSATLRSAIK
ncbi:MULTISPECIES: AAA family ATPase [Lachnospiraceae]|jgi:5-methylcytosine-specific restriction protein B|uniref:AAA family ATPase n=1 Tax=Lachnospiraceae TaxID=186803 RepID=UPI001D068A00|nr:MULTISPECIES: AAA family ATPase [Lachnospiraceae]MCC3184055.1 AAA family ATPase [[Clostridium] innocuum]MCB6283078.1 AAA family ATPase [Dorea formicigenerans]MCB6392114.1 AAA family ATPase [Dorea formicigenerans]MCB6393651.1 AAA family ATPase [Dorea formicigenerans]MCB6411545.1 AAA family ATPase [Dorea formicigenerans]